MGVETYPKGSRPAGVVDGEAAGMQERTGSPYFNKATMGDSDEETMKRRMNIYGSGTKDQAQGHQYSDPRDQERKGFPVNPRRTMITS